MRVAAGLAGSAHGNGDLSTERETFPGSGVLVITYVQRFTSVSGMRPVVAVDTVGAACLLLTPRSALAAIIVELLIVCSVVNTYWTRGYFTFAFVCGLCSKSVDR